MFNILRDKEKMFIQRVKQKTVLCIPGNWKNRTEIVMAIAENNLNEFIFAGMILLNLKTNMGFELEICERDNKLKESFRCAGMVNSISEEFLTAVDRHSYVIYLSAETGNMEKAKLIADA